MKTIRSFVLTGLLLIVSLLSFSQKKKDGAKRANVLPVYLIYSGLPADSSTNKIVREAFIRHKVKLIGYKEFNSLNEGEALRIRSKFRSTSSSFETESEARSAIAKEQKFVTNMVTVHFNTVKIADSLNIRSITWEATPFPPNLTDPRPSRQIETLLEDPCCSLQDIVNNLVDKVLFSKWLR